MTAVGPKLMSVFNLWARTNNAVEAYHGVLGNVFGIHFNICHFTSKYALVKLLVPIFVATNDCIQITA